jgi:hypothetical protein
MATIEQHLNNLSEPHRTQALNNVISILKDFEQEGITDSEALIRAFDWEDSSQGFDYWEQLYDKLVEEGN